MINEKVTFGSEAERMVLLIPSFPAHKQDRHPRHTTMPLLVFELGHPPVLLSMTLLYAVARSVGHLVPQ